jgi:hypothetical protein
MQLPHANRAVISSAKLSRYLLDPNHERGGAKARFFIRLGFHPESPADLVHAIRRNHLPLQVMQTVDTAHGTQYVIVGTLTSPSGRSALVRSVWQIDSGTQAPRLITMYPEN